MTAFAGTGSVTRDQRRTLAVSVAAAFLVLSTYTLPLTTLDHTGAALGSSAGGEAWILSSMSLGLAAALLVSGAIADDRGRRRAFVIGATVLSVSSIVAAVAPSTGVLIAARVLEGVGGAALTSAGLGLLGNAFGDPVRRARATGVWGAGLGAGIAAGPLIAGGLDVVLGWRASYWCIAVLAAGLAVTGRRLLAESAAELPRPVDYVGAALLASGLSALLAGLVQGRAGWAQPMPVALLVVGTALLVAFWRSQAVRRGPMLDLKLFHRKDFLAATTGALANGLSIIAVMSYIPTLIQRGLQHGPLAAALVLLAWSATSVVTALLARRLPAGIEPRHEMVFALIGVGVGQLLLCGLDIHSSLWRLIPGLVVAGVASGVLNAALARQSVASVPAGGAAMGSGANNTARYVGAAVGVTVVVVVAGGVGAQTVVAGWNLAVLVTAGLSFLGAAAVFACRTPGRFLSKSPRPFR
jgi:MFS family permease